MNQVITLDKVINEQIPDIEYYVAEILREKGYAALIGKRKMGKSYLAISLALCLAAGRDWLGRRVRPEGCTVLYLNYEISDEKFLERLQDITKATGITPNDNFMFQTTRGERIPIDTDPRVMADVIEDCPRMPQVVFLDPRYGFIIGDENKGTDLTNFVDGIQKLEEEYDMAFVIVAHMGKHPELGARGHSVFEDGADTLLYLNEATGKSYTRELQIIGKDIEETKLGLNFDYPLFKIKNPEITDLPQIEKAKELVLRMIPKLRADIIREGRRFNLSSNSIQRAIDQLKDVGEVTIEPIPMPGNHKLIKPCVERVIN
jgi:hypothetical protein